MKNPRFLVSALLLAVILLAIWLWNRPGLHEDTAPEITLAMSPYQDLAMIVNAEPLGLPKKYGTKVNLVTMAWEDILPAVASNGKSVDVGFGSLVEYLTKYDKLNAGAADPILYIQPLYVYKGGGFVALNPQIKPLTRDDLRDHDRMVKFLKYRIGAQKQSLYEMMIFTLARRSNVPLDSLHIFDTPMNDGLLAMASGSLDVSSAGLTQLNEAKRRGGSLILSMEDSGFADVTGFICRKSTLEKKRKQIEDLIRMWFDSVNYVLEDTKSHSQTSLTYLRQQAATQYTYDEYITALGQEFLPRTVNEANEALYKKGSAFDVSRIANEIEAYLVDTHLINQKRELPDPLVAR